MLPVNILLSVVALVTAVVLLFLSIYLFQLRHSEQTAVASLFFFLASAVFTAGYGVELLQSDVGVMERCIQLKSVGIVFIPSLFLWLAAAFSSPGKIITRCVVPLALGFSSLLALSVLTNGSHHLYYAHITLDSYGPFPTARIAYGPLFYVLTCFYLMCNVATISLFFYRFRLAEGLERQRMMLMGVSAILALIEPFVFMANILPWHLDVGPYFLTGICLFMCVGIRHFGLFDVRTLARQMVFNAMDDAVLVVLANQEIIDWNPAVLRFFPDEGSSLAKKRLLDLSANLASLYEKLSFEKHGELVLSVDQSPVYLKVCKHLVTLINGRGVGVAIVLRDITDDKRKIAVLEDLATSDSLTGICNRRHWLSQVINAMKQYRREGISVCVLMIDIDLFKEVNDTWGHAAGDLALRHVTRVISGCLRTPDIFGRWGGEEFAIYLPGCSRADGAAIAERIRTAVGTSPMLYGEADIGVTVSIGVTAFEGDTGKTDVETLLRRADQALYLAKQNGRNRIEYSRADSQSSVKAQGPANVLAE